jgi:hypothetical protein
VSQVVLEYQVVVAGLLLLAVEELLVAVVVLAQEVVSVAQEERGISSLAEQVLLDPLTKEPLVAVQVLQVMVAQEMALLAVQVDSVVEVGEPQVLV